MDQTAQIAKHLREVFFGGNWTCSNVKEHLADVTWQQATSKVHSFNTIATLVYHSCYYVDAVIKVLQGKSLEAKDELSFGHPPVQSQEDWDDLVNKVMTSVETLASLIEKMPEDKLRQDIADAKYGSYYRNLHGIIEHTHYHLGQIVLIKKLLQLEKVQGS